jgi:hypothetical protein
MNTELLIKVREAIMAHPHNTDMVAGWILHSNFQVAQCGTTGCIAGWAIAGGDLEKLRKRREATGAGHQVRERAKKLLDITEAQADRLFHVYAWPPSLKWSYDSATTWRMRAKITARRIDHFINTGGKE